MAETYSGPMVPRIDYEAATAELAIVVDAWRRLKRGALTQTAFDQLMTDNYGLDETKE